MKIRGYAPGAPCWADVSTPDPATARRFYSHLFGWKTDDAGGYTVFRLGDNPVAGLAPTTDPGGPCAWLVYITVSDVDITAKVVDAAGGQVLLEPCEMGEAGRTALFADPTGGVFAGWQPGMFRGAQASTEPGALCWYGLTSPEPAATLAFYAEVFGWRERPDESSPGGYEWRNGEDVVAGVLPGPRAGWTAHVMVADCVATVVRAEALGGRLLGQAVDTALCRYAYLADPGGARFAVAQLAPEVRRALL
jgi:predicted enzyme related to lactoylglutathione lyase